MAEPGTYKMEAPDGTQVEVVGADRRDVLAGRGYTLIEDDKKKSSKGGGS